MEGYFDNDDLKDVWETDIDPDMQEVLDEDSEMSDWLIRDSKSVVVLHDRLMTDAALGAAPIKTEHSYSLHSDVESAPSSPHHTKVDDMEDECYPAMPASAWSSRRRSSDSPVREVKTEPKSEPDSPASSCPPSPTPGTPVTHLDYVIDHTTGTIHMPPAVLQKVGAAGVPQLLLSAAPRLANSLGSNKLSIKVTSSASGFNLPPTPPSSLSSSDSEGALSPAREAGPPAAPPAPRRPHLYVSHHSRQPINTPLISSQPKGSTGTLVLTEEEKRTLLAEGYPVPTRLPLSKAEEKSLKKIRRKIKNKISAQESRRKKKEYMDQLERKVEILVSENSDYRKRVDTLEQKNASLLSQLAALQALVTRGNRK
ncbi:cyclic AMP response element-binding protein A isoform X1 [Plodia interpunctella]|uniref:cyclic AMP response element-binding protein A isoform X1 n=1 Tax=Plodia interpunctella TaxID=58824 RepID=UPI002367E22E|nr:cyclic AMP response element-binding protein A isoform X1 [Plodia interpunctella]